MVLELGRCDANRSEDFFEIHEPLVGVEASEIPCALLADGRDSVADFVAGFVGVSVQVSPGVLVEAGGEVLLETVEGDTVYIARDHSAA